MSPQGPFHRENPHIMPPLQYLMFTQGWAVKCLTAVGLRASNVLVAAGPGVAGLGPIPTLLTGMYAVAGIRHGYWALFTTSNYCPTGASLQIVVYNATVNIINTLVAVHALTSSHPTLGSFTDCIGWKQWAGLAIFAIGISMEMIAEDSRKQFKKDPKNKGKIDDTGLWSVVRHPNYLGYLLWRIGISLTTGSLIATTALASLQLAIFCCLGIPEISSYMVTKYDVQWMEYKKRVPYALFPGIF
ncbi:S5A-REDUCTASE domain-containing protein [Mycena venus]|uniref:S5A-REDUCTASE domain-containing protein n=1 Tax=Mycena venus TaxID=2733690 RepID=A0A8H7D8C7_9AGAR|nr:S5A-REDUCTASE domain-containing protein [Mycena venus]